MNTTVGFGTTFILGALHALEPGHGKSFMAAYIAGEKLNIKHLLTLIVSIFVSHFLVLLFVAFILKYAFQGSTKEQMMEFFHRLGPLLVIAFGLYLLARYYITERKARKPHDCSNHLPPLEGPLLTKTAFVGLVSGMFPCPTAVAALIFSGMDNSFANAPLYILIYALGMSLMMIKLILIFYYARERLAGKLQMISAKVNPHLLSAVIILIIGFVYLGYNTFKH